MHPCSVSRPLSRAILVVAALGAAFGATSASAQTVDASQVPTYADSVQRGIRSRVDIWGRELAVGNPDPAVQLIVPDVVDDKNDTQAGGQVIFGWDRPFGVPIAGDFMGDYTGHVFPNSPVSPFLDDSSLAPRAHLYSAFIGLSGAPGEALEPFKLNVGRMTEIGESPITYDGLSTGVKLKFPKLGYLNAIVWGGLDAPQHLANDPFTRTDSFAYSEKYQDLSGFVSPTGGLQIVRTPLGTTPNLNGVGGLNIDGRVAGIGFALHHTSMPAGGSIVIDKVHNVFLPLQRTKLGGSYMIDSDALSLIAGVDLHASDFLPRSANVYGDFMTGDGTTRIGANIEYQFLEDICGYDCTFRAFNPATTINQVQDSTGTLTNDVVESIRVHDQIRHLNIGPTEPHFAVVLDGERAIGGGFSLIGRGRLRQHFDDKVLDYFRTNVYEVGGGVDWSSGLAFEAGDEIYGGLMNSGTDVNKGNDYTLVDEGVTSYVENRLYVRTVLLDGKLSNLAEVFGRREDIVTKAVLASGQWSGSFADTIRYDVLDFWSVSARLEADELSPLDALNGSGYFGALVGTSFKL
jgi:hypothetical protein